MIPDKKYEQVCYWVKTESGEYPCMYCVETQRSSCDGEHTSSKGHCLKCLKVHLCHLEDGAFVTTNRNHNAFNN